MAMKLGDRFRKWMTVKPPPPVCPWCIAQRICPDLEQQGEPQ